MIVNKSHPAAMQDTAFITSVIPNVYISGDANYL